MEQKDKIQAVEHAGYSSRDYQDWYEKYRRHSKHAEQRAIPSYLSFGDYLQKAKEAGLNQPDQIGVKTGQYHLSREGDGETPYANETCRFLVGGDNRRESFANNCHSDLVGQTKETSERVRKISESLIGRNKSNDPYRADVANKISNDFVLTSPSGETIQGRNLKEFCHNNGLSQGLMSMVCNGKRNHHRGWTGYYVPPNVEPLTVHFPEDEV